MGTSALKRIKKGLKIRTGVVRLSDLVFILAYDPKKEEREIEHTYIYMWDQGKFYEGYANYIMNSCCIIKDPEVGCVITGGAGDFTVQTREDFIEGNIFENSHPKPAEPRYGQIRSVSEIGGRAYAVGLRGMVYRLDDLSDWTRIDDGLSGNFNAQAIHGSGISDLYAVGRKGEICLFDGSTWAEIEKLAENNLSCVKCISDETVYIGGYKGTLIYGRKDKWKLLNTENMTDDIWDLEWFKEQLYVSTMHGLYRLEGDKLRKVDFGNDTPKTTYHLSAIEEVMWSFGREDVMAYDGNTWKRMV